MPRVKQDSIDVIDNKNNNGAKEIMASVDTNNMVLELSRSATNAKDLSSDNNEDNNAKSKERDHTNNIKNKSNDGAKEAMASGISLIQDTRGKEDITNNKNKQVITMPRTILIVETKMQEWTRLRMTT